MLALTKIQESHAKTFSRLNMWPNRIKWKNVGSEGIVHRRELLRVSLCSLAISVAT